MSVAEYLHDTLRRTETARTGPNGRTSVLRRSAEELSRRTVLAARCEVLNWALGRLAELVYEEGYYNVDRATGRILIPVPMGRNGYADYGLTPMERDVLRHILRARQRGDNRDYPAWLRFYNRSWHAYLAWYQDLGAAQEYLGLYEVTVDLWVRGYAAYRRQNSRSGGRAGRRGGGPQWAHRRQP